MFLTKRIEEGIGNPNNNEIETLRSIWASFMANLFEAGGTDTANVVVSQNIMNEEVNFDDNHKETGINNTGVRSNVEQGWSLAFYSIEAAAPTFRLHLSLDWILETPSGSSSPPLSWINDEEQNQ